MRLAIERVTQRSLRDLLADLMFAPIGLRQTFVAANLGDAGGLAPGYSSDLDSDGQPLDVRARYHPG